MRCCFSAATKQAIEAYTAHKGETLPGNSKWEDAILKDFAEFRKRGLGHPRLRRVEEALAAAPDSPEVLDQTASKLAQAGKYAEAVPLAERYLKEMKSRYGEEHRKYAVALNNLASRYQQQGRYVEAESLFKQSLAISERVWGPEHIETLFRAHNLAGLYSSQGRYSEAEALYKRALQGEERVLGPDHDGTLTVVNNLALLYANAGRYAEAEPLNKRVLESRERRTRQRPSHHAGEPQQSSDLICEPRPVRKSRATTQAGLGDLRTRARQ